MHLDGGNFTARGIHGRRRRRIYIVGAAQLVLFCRAHKLYYVQMHRGRRCVCLLCVCAYSYIQINKITHQCHRGGEWIIFPPVVKTMGAAAAAATAEK